MVWYDFVVLAILIFTSWQGAQRGFVTQLAWIAALILCFKFADKLAPAIEPQINVEQPLRHYIAMFILYLGFSLGSFLAARILNSWMEKAKFKDFDRHLGGMLGFVKGATIALVLTFFAVTLSNSLKAVVLQSYSGKGACWVLDNVEPITPEYFHEYLARYQQELEPIHNEHLGSPASINDLWGDRSGPNNHRLDGEFQLPDVSDGLIGTNSGRSGPAGSSGVTQGPSFDEAWRSLPQRLKDQFGSQIHEQWMSSTPAQRQKFMDNLEASFDVELPDIVTNFLLSTGSPNQPRSGGGQGTSGDLLSRIANAYDQDRQMVLENTQKYFIGVPSQVQQAVLADWYADLSLQSSDPDPLTNIETRLDDRIIRQLDRAGIPIRRLSFDLQQRLNRSLR